MAKLLISAGESSGDQRAAALLTELRELVPDLEVFGMGGGALREAGCRIEVDSSGLDVMGFADVLRRIPEFRGVMRKLVAAAERERPDAAVLCDYPGFNLRLAARLKEKGVRVIYYVSPQVWAWAPRRARRIARLVDKMLVLFPFEEKLYRGLGLDSEFVGHPLADELPGDYPAKAEALRAELGLGDEEEVLAILPGSRPMELERHLEVFAAAAARVREARGAVRPVIAVRKEADAGKVAERARAAAGFEVPVLAGRAREVRPPPSWRWWSRARPRWRPPSWAAPCWSATAPAGSTTRWPGCWLPYLASPWPTWSPGGRRCRSSGSRRSLPRGWPTPRWRSWRTGRPARACAGPWLLSVRS